MIHPSYWTSLSDALRNQNQIMNNTCYPLSLAVREEAIGVLNNTVADLFHLFERIKLAHGNVRGADPIGMHKLLDEYAGRVMNHINLAARRVMALGGAAGGPSRGDSQHSRPGKRGKPAATRGMSGWIHALDKTHVSADERVLFAIKQLTVAEDFGTVDLLTDILLTLDLQLMLLETHIKGKTPKKAGQTPNAFTNAVNPILKIVIVHEDLLTDTEASAVLSRMAAQLEAELDIKSDIWQMESGIWSFEMLRDAKLREQALAEAVTADIIFVCGGGAGLPAQVRQWLEGTLPLKEGGPAALVALLNQSADLVRQAVSCGSLHSATDRTIRPGFYFQLRRQCTMQCVRHRFTPQRSHLVASRLQTRTPVSKPARMKMFKFSLIMAAALAAMPLMQGCALLVVGGVAAGAAYGTVKYVNNTLEVTQNVSLDNAWSAANQALDEMQMPVTKSTKDAASGRLESRNAENQPVTIQLTRKTDTVTEIHITVGTFDSTANRTQAQQIYDQMKARF